MRSAGSLDPLLFGVLGSRPPKVAVVPEPAVAPLLVAGRLGAEQVRGVIRRNLISSQPLSYEERRDRWLRDTGNLWRTGSDSADRQRI